MKEKTLKELFISSLRSGHIDYISSSIPRVNTNYEVTIKEEGYFRNFDLVIALRQKFSVGSKKPRNDYLDLSDERLNIVMRSGLFTKFALKEKCRIDSIAFYPVEIKSDQDALDERLTHQVLNALLFFGRSIVVLGTRHSSAKQLRNICKYLPATFIGYTGQDDHFKVISSFDRFINTNIYFLRKRSLARLLVNNGVEIERIHRIYRCLENIQRINQKIAFSQLNFHDDAVLLPEELEFINKLVDITMKSTKRAAEKLVKNSLNTKITDVV
jgi:hypothetical protein